MKIHPLGKITPGETELVKAAVPELLTNIKTVSPLPPFHPERSSHANLFAGHHVCSGEVRGGEEPEAVSEYMLIPGSDRLRCGREMGWQGWGDEINKRINVL